MLTSTGSISSLFDRRCAEHPDDLYLTFAGEAYTVQTVRELVLDTATTLRSAGVGSGHRVLVMLSRGPEQVGMILALAEIGAVFVPADLESKAPQVAYVLEDADPDFVIVEQGPDQVLRQAQVLWPSRAQVMTMSAGQLSPAGSNPPGPAATPSVDQNSAAGLVSILYTSGTSGPPKGVMVTDTMLRACAASVIEATEPVTGDIFFQWETLNHVGGLQILVVALERRVSIAMVDRFSASSFWAQVRESCATHIHYLGGVLAILQSAPATEHDRDHQVRFAWGAGATTENWLLFEQRFGVRIREVYGLTESSSINLVNHEGVVGSVGRPLDMFQIAVVDPATGDRLPSGEVGELRIHSETPGVLTPGYHRRPEATERLYADGWLCTGDLVHQDGDGNVFYAGRLTDSVRRRGQNISAWEVERVVRQHESIEDCALVGVPSPLGEDDLLLFVQFRNGDKPQWTQLAQWCSEYLPSYQVPRFFAEVRSFPRGPSQRILKTSLPKTAADAWDRTPGR